MQIALHPDHEQRAQSEEPQCGERFRPRLRRAGGPGDRRCEECVGPSGGPLGAGGFGGGRFRGRNGTGASFTTAPVVTGDDYSTFTNNLNGLLTFTGAFWSNSNTAAARTLTLGGTGNMLISGSIIASGGASFDHVLVKSGTGTVTLSGVAATLDGATSVSSGPLVITDFRSLGGAANSTAINLGNTTTTAGVLTFGTSVAATAALPSNRVTVSGSFRVGRISASVATLFIGWAVPVWSMKV